MINAQLIRIAIVTFISVTACFVLYPWYQKTKEQSDATRSLASLRAIGGALKSYEEENGHLPYLPSWKKAVLKYSDEKDIADPTYKRIDPDTKACGWGVNLGIPFSIGKLTDEGKEVKNSQDFPQDTIIIMPSYETTVIPNRDGSVNPQPISENKKALVEHTKRLGSIGGRYGNSGLYLNLAGAILKMPPEEAAKMLKLRDIPESKKIKIVEEKAKKEAIGNEINWEENNKVEHFASHIMLKGGEISTPLIPLSAVGGQLPDVVFDMSSPEKISVKTTVEFYNKNKELINVKEGNERQPMTENYVGDGRITTKDKIPLEKGKSIAIYPEDGHACFSATITKESFPLYGTNKITSMTPPIGYETRIDPITINIKKGTDITELADFRKVEWIETAGKGEWETISALKDTNNIPEISKYICVKIKTSVEDPLLIKNIKVRKKNEKSNNNENTSTSKENNNNNINTNNSTSYNNVSTNNTDTTKENSSSEKKY
jgi:hypothetical protein